MKKTIRYITRGFLITVPILFGLYITVNFYFFVAKIIPGKSIIITLLVLIGFFMLIGFLFTNTYSHHIDRLIRRHVHKYPMIESVYNACTHVFASPTKHKVLEKPVLLKSPDSIEHRLGFITNEDIDALGLEEHVAVFIPDAFTFSGTTIFMKKSDLTLIDLNGFEAYSMMISGGLVQQKVTEE